MFVYKAWFWVEEIVNSKNSHGMVDKFPADDDNKATKEYLKLLHRHRRVMKKNGWRVVRSSLSKTVVVHTAEYKE